MYKDITKCNKQFASEQELVVFDGRKDHSKVVSANHLWSPLGYNHLLTLRVKKCIKQVVSEVPQGKELVVFDGRKDHSKVMSANHLWSPLGYHHLLTLRMYK